MSTLPAGTKIVCPNGHPVGELQKDLLPETLISVDYMKFEEGQEKIAGERATCGVCGTLYIVPVVPFGPCRIHTEDGWKPY